MISLTRRRTPQAPARNLHAPLAPHTRQIVGNLLVQKNGKVLAGVRPGPVRWDYTTDQDKLATMNQIQDVWASLLGRTVHERVTATPFPVERWAARLDRRTPNPLPDIHTCEQQRFTKQQLLDGACGCETWGRHLLRMQQRIRQGNMNRKVTFRYFGIGQIDSDVNLRHHILAYRDHQIMPPDAVKEILVEAKKIENATRMAGWHAEPMTEREQLWLRQRSVGFGVPHSDLSAYGEGAEAGELAAFTDSTRWHEEPWDRHVKVVAWREGRRIERAVQVLSCARLADLHYPENGLDGWQAYLDNAADAHGRRIVGEWSLNGRLYTGDELAAQARMDLKHAEHTINAYRKFGEETPPEIANGYMRAREVKTSVDNGQPRDAGRFVGTINIAIYGEDVYNADGVLIESAADNVERKGEAIRAHFRGVNMRMPFEVPQAQWAKLAEFTPGEPYDKDGYIRQIPLDYLAAGVPTASVEMGDGHGPYTGYTAGANPTPVMHDSHYATEGQGSKGRQQNMWIVQSTLGGGKTTKLSHIAYQNARRGHKVVARDPSGPMLHLPRMPELAPWGFGFDLLAGEDGILSPPSLVRQPLLTEFGGDEGKWQRALKTALGERRNLTVNLAWRCLDYDLYSNPETTALLRDAARQVEWNQAATIWDLIAKLPVVGSSARAKHAKSVRDALVDASILPGFSLLFPPKGEGGDFAPIEYADKSFIVITTPGIKRAEDNVAREHWNAEERMADVVLTASNHYATKMLYGKEMYEPAVAIFDEAEDYTDNSVGRASLVRLGRDHSKWNIAVYLGLKHFDEHMLAGGLRNFLAGAMVGRMANIAPAEAVLDVLNIEDRHHARDLLRLSRNQPGQFVELDADGRVGKKVEDILYHPRLAEVVFTNPGGQHSADVWHREDVIG